MKHSQAWFRVVTSIFQKPLALVGGVLLSVAPMAAPGAERDLHRRPERAAGYGPQVTLPFSGLSGPWGLAVDGAGDLFVADPSNNSAVEMQMHSVNFAGANVCAPGATTPAPCSQTLTLTYNVNADTTLGEPQVATGALKYLDFNRASGSTCVGAVTAGATCTMFL